MTESAEKKKKFFDADKSDRKVEDVVNAFSASLLTIGMKAPPPSALWVSHLHAAEMLLLGMRELANEVEKLRHTLSSERQVHLKDVRLKDEYRAEVNRLKRKMGEKDG